MYYATSAQRAAPAQRVTMATGKQGKQLRSARGSSDNDMLDAIKEALHDDNILAGLAKRNSPKGDHRCTTERYGQVGA